MWSDATPEHIYHMMTLAQLKELTPNFEWAEFLTEVGARAGFGHECQSTRVFQGLNASLTSVSPRGLEVYLRWHLIHRCRAGTLVKICE